MIPPSEERSVPLLALKGITVRFGAFLANDRVDLSVASGSIHALIGENGAGKTTLMRVVSGLLAPDAGTVRVEGRPVALRSVHAATALGIGMVHQHFMLVPTLTVAQNACLGLARAGRLFPDLRGVARAIGAIGEAYGLRVDPAAIVGQLSIAGQQRAEIVKALYRGARLLVLDEPTAVLAPGEVEGLFGILRTLAAGGAGIVFISHKLHEVMGLADRATVLRHGRVVARTAIADTDERALARAMVGEDIVLPAIGAAPAPSAAGPILAIADLVCRDERGIVRVAGASLTVGRGEIVGVAGVDGNGQGELAEAVVGLRIPTGGIIRLAGDDVTAAPPAGRIARGLAHIPEDRHRTAIVDAMSIADNAALDGIGRTPLSRGGWISRRAVAALGARLVARYGVRCTGPQQIVGTLSGGNQQKLVLGRALGRDPSLIVAVQPARGLDIGATAFVRRELLGHRDRGAGILLVSTDLDEILALSDRVAVMSGGRIVGVMDRATVSIEGLGRMMTAHAT